MELQSTTFCRVKAADFCELRIDLLISNANQKTTRIWSRAQSMVMQLRWQAVLGILPDPPFVIEQLSSKLAEIRPPTIKIVVSPRQKQILACLVCHNIQHEISFDLMLKPAF